MSSEAWTHLMCAPCWFDRHPNRKPARVAMTVTNNCCFCGAETMSGIYARHNGTELPLCEGHKAGEGEDAEA